MITNSSPARRFIRLDVEMLVAMFGGMVLLGFPVEAALRAIGTSTSDLRIDVPRWSCSGWRSS